MTPYEKYCILTFDGVALKSKKQHIESSDVVSGFVDLNQFQEEFRDCNTDRAIHGSWNLRQMETASEWAIFATHIIQVTTLKEMICVHFKKLNDFALSTASFVERIDQIQMY